MNIDCLLIKDFEEISSLIVNIYLANNKTTFFKCPAYLYYLGGELNKVDIIYPYSNPDMITNRAISSLAKLLPELRNDMGDGTYKVELPYVEEANYKRLDEWGKLAAKYINFDSYDNFNIRTDRILNIEDIESSLRPSSYVISISYF